MKKNQQTSLCETHIFECIVMGVRFKQNDMWTNALDMIEIPWDIMK